MLEVIQEEDKVKCIKDLNYIRFCDDYSKISNIINELMLLDNPKYKNELYSSWYDNLVDTIKT